MSGNGVNMFTVNGVKIQQDLIKNIVKNDDKTTVVFQDGTTVGYGAQKTEKAKIYKEKYTGFIVFENLNGANIRGTDKDDKYVIWDGSYLDVDTGDGNDTIDATDLQNSLIYSGAGNDLIEVSSGEEICINSGSGEDEVEIAHIKGADVGHAESVIPSSSERVHIFGNNKTTKVHAGPNILTAAELYGALEFYPNLKDSTIECVPKENVNVFYLENVEIKASDESAGKKEIQ